MELKLKFNTYLTKDERKLVDITAQEIRKELSKHGKVYYHSSNATESFYITFKGLKMCFKCHFGKVLKKEKLFDLSQVSSSEQLVSEVLAYCKERGRI